MSSAEFEARYQADPDPWGYTTSEYEREKYAATLAACGRGPFAHALELGGSIGVFSSMLARRSARLTTIDAAPTAVAIARRRLAGHGQVHALRGSIPDELPDQRFDLVVASEVLYYLTATELAATLAALRARMVSGARLVAVHWRPAGRERPLDAQSVHRSLREQPWLDSESSDETADYLLDVLSRR